MATTDDLIALVESAYRVEQDEPQWLQGVVDAALPVLGRGMGVYGLAYDVSNPADFKVDALCGAGHPEMDAMSRVALQSMHETDVQFVEQVFQVVPCALASETNLNQTNFVKFSPWGIKDVLALNGVDPEGHGVLLGVLYDKKQRLTAKTRARLSRVAVHLASGRRILRRLGRGQKHLARTEAVLTPAGKVEHAEGEAAEKSALAALEQATVDIERARAKRGEDAVERWKTLVTAKWSIVEEYDAGGKRWALARRNEPAAAGIEGLTARERQVVALAALGRTAKLIAYELGIADATARVLLSRAKAKMGVTSKKELVMAYLMAAMNGSGSSPGDR